MKKSISFLLSVTLMTSLFIIPKYQVKAITNVNYDNEQQHKQDQEELLGEFIEYKNEQGEIIVEPYDSNFENKTKGSYRETTTYKVYNQGITQKWSWTSRPYFITSIAQGMSYEKSRTVSGNVSATFSNGLNDTGVKKAISKNFGLSYNYSKTISEKVIFSGPTGSYSRRDFYYKLGRHNHKIKVVKEVRANQGIGLISRKEYSGTVGIPAILTYSENVK